MIEIKDLTRRFGMITAVRKVSLGAERGEVVGFLGPNGAGKSTTMKMVAGFLPPSSGTALVCGHDVRAETLAVQRRLGYLPEGAPAYPDMTPESLLRFVAGVRGITGKERRERIARARDMVNLAGVMRQPIETLSKGYKRRVGLAQAVLHDPDVLILDEPTDGLDPNQKHEVRRLIREMAGKKVVILSTHILEEVDAVCTRAVVITRGEVVADCTPEELRSRAPSHNSVYVTARADESSLGSALRAIPTVASVESSSEDGMVRCTVFPKDGASIVSDVSECLRRSNARIDELRVERGRLDEVFREITTRGKTA